MTRHHAQPLEFSFAADSFTLEIEQTLDGERLSRELEQSRADQLAAERQQSKLPFDSNINDKLYSPSITGRQ